MVFLSLTFTLELDVAHREYSRSDPVLSSCPLCC